MFQRKTLAAFVVVCLAALFPLNGCGFPTAPKPIASPSAPVSAMPADAKTITPVLQKAVNAFLANDFNTARNFFRLPGEETSAAKSRQMFADFSSHINKRFALQAKDAALTSTAPVLSVDEVRAGESGQALAVFSLRAAEELPPLLLTAKMTRSQNHWLVDFDSFLLSLIDALDE